VTLPVFKTGASREFPGLGRFDSDTLPPGFLRFAQDFGARLPLGGFAASLTPRKRLKFDSDTLPPGFLRFAQDFGTRLPLGGFAVSLTPRKRLKLFSAV
jgi:hypothetical protein